MADTNGTKETDYALGMDETHESTLRKVRTAGSISIPPDLFEKLYLSPENRVKGDLRKTFGNPTPLGLGGFLLSLTPLSCMLMNWRNTAAYKGASDIAAYLFFGGLLMTMASVQEWILGNTFIATIFGTFGAFWLTLGGTLQPFYYAYGFYSPNPNNEAAGLNAAFFNSFGFFLVFMGLLCLVYTLCALRTNVIFVCILLPLPIAFGFLAASYWYAAEGNMSYALTMQITGGAFTFITDMFGWYLFSSLMLASIDAPISLPVFDLSTKIKGASERRADDNV